jgi:hypothetical protein
MQLLCFFNSHSLDYSKGYYSTDSKAKVPCRHCRREVEIHASQLFFWRKGQEEKLLSHASSRGMGPVVSGVISSRYGKF